MILILGVPRSGTSMVSQFMAKSGHKLAGGGFIETNHHNPDGYYEDAFLSVMSASLLDDAKSTWYDPKEVTELGKYTKHFVDYKSAHGLEGWKDPKLTWTLPAFKRYIDDPLLIIVHRNKEDNVASLEKAWETARKTFNDEDVDFHTLYDKYWAQLERLKLGHRWIQLDYDAILETVKPDMKHI